MKWYHYFLILLSIPCAMSGEFSPVPRLEASEESHQLYRDLCYGNQNLKDPPVISYSEKECGVDLNDNQLDTLDNDFFKKLPGLELLLLKSNKFTKFPDLKHARSLELLDLSDNIIETVTGTTFEFCYELKCLALTANNITTIEPGTFLLTPHLITLDIRDNPICRELDPNHVRETWGLPANCELIYQHEDES